MENYIVELAELVNPPHTDSISGRELGKKHAEDKRLIAHLDKNEKIILVIDNERIKAINDSFIKGFFNKVFIKYKYKNIVEKHIEIRSSEYFKRLIEKNWSVLEAVYK